MIFSRRRFLAAGSTVVSLGWPGWFDEQLVVEKTRASIACVKDGITWLKKARNPRGGFGVDIGRADDIGCTAMTGLALLADGSTPVQGRNKETLRTIESYLVKKVQNMPGGNITSKSGTQLQHKIGIQAHTFFALLFLSQIAGESHLPGKTVEAVRKLTKCVVGSQRADGSWGSQSWAPTLGTVMGWTSLRSAHFAGMKVGGSPEKTAEYLLGQMGQKMTNRQGWMHKLYKNATGIRVLYAMGKENESVAKSAFEQVIELVTKNNTAFNQAGGEEYLAFHLITETMLQKTGKDWKSWFPVVRDKIIQVQNKDGSWTGHHCITSRTFCTAAAILVLSAPNRYLPISQK